MDWILIVFMAGHFTFAGLFHSQEACEKLGNTFVVEEKSDYVCVSSENFAQHFE